MSLIIYIGNIIFIRSCHLLYVLFFLTWLYFMDFTLFRMYPPLCIGAHNASQQLQSFTDTNRVSHVGCTVMERSEQDTIIDDSFKFSAQIS